METMMELKHPRRLEKKANIRSDRRWSDMWSGLSQAAAIVRSRAERRRANQGWLPLIATGFAGLRGYCAQADDQPSAKQLQLTLFSGMTRGYDQTLIRLA
jgi:hypothetical protein